MTIIIHNASEVFTSAPSYIRNGAVVIEGDRIAAVGKSDDVLDAYSGELVDAKGGTVLPGFVDSHTHLVFEGTREFELELKLKGYSYMDIMKMGGGISYTVKNTREASEDILKKSALSRLDTMLLHGTTTIEAKSGYGLTVEDEMKILDVTTGISHEIDILPTFMGAHSIPEEYFSDTEGYVDLVINEMIQKAKSKAKFIDVFCEKGIFTQEQSREILLAGKEAGMIPKIHADEFENTGGAALAAEVGAISADHLLRASEEGLKAMAQAGTIATLLPGTPYTLMNGDYPDINMFRNSGVKIALATDFNPNCFMHSLPFIISLACYNMKMTPDEAIRGATINGAKALGIECETGSIEPGKLADLAIFSVPSHLFIPYNPGINNISTVFKKGRMVVKDGVIVR